MRLAPSFLSGWTDQTSLVELQMHQIFEKNIDSWERTA